VDVCSNLRLCGAWLKVLRARDGAAQCPRWSGGGPDPALAPWRQGEVIHKTAE